MLRHILWICLSLVSTFMISCASTDDANMDSAEGLFNSAQSLEKDERYEEALARYQDVKNKHPYSRFATQSELAIADIHYLREEYPEAQVAYQTFREFHPKHPKIDYVTQRLAMSFFKQLPSTIDRDLTLASRAITYFDEVLQRYPKSEYVPEAKEKRDLCLKMLAEKEVYIADFYFRRAQYDSALNRYEIVLAKFSDLGFDKKAMRGAALSAYRSGENDRAKSLLNAMKKDFPDASETRDVEREVK